MMEKPKSLMQGNLNSRIEKLIPATGNRKYLADPRMNSVQRENSRYRGIKITKAQSMMAN